MATTTTTTTSSEAPAFPLDHSSLSNPDQVRVTHLEWTIQEVNFTDRIWKATAAYTLERVQENASVLQLDTVHLNISQVTFTTTKVTDAEESTPEVQTLTFRLKPGSKPHLGTQLEIDLPPAAAAGATEVIAIQYQTTPASSAIQWLPKSQTFTKKHPYLFTQAQAIHGRSMLPCQDQPGVKMTYHAAVTVPSWAVCVMSAVLQEITTPIEPQQAATTEEQPPTTAADTSSSTHTYHWQQNIPVSSYLIAMAVGDLVKQDISSRCAVWSEPAMVQIAADEFSQVEDFLQIAEQLAGPATPYLWGRYDLLCLPPSFPYGGMENPCLTFVTPTLLARDKSLAGVVAHEIAHSWTGNLVTNATWEHFWLNEGWTKWLERKIITTFRVAASSDVTYRQQWDFDALAGYQNLQNSMAELPAKYQSLVLPMGDCDPDEAYSIVAYEKGCSLLSALERRVGTPAFEGFFQEYVHHFAKKALTSEDFKAFFLDYFKDQEEAVKDIDWDAWFYQPGMPPEEPEFDRSLAGASEQLAVAWIAVDREGGPVPTTDISAWTTDQITWFLDYLETLTAQQPLTRATLKLMDDLYTFSQTQNAEIMFRFCMISIAAEDESMIMVILYFITSQGRMKFVRPLYKALHRSVMGHDIAVSAFLKQKDSYHPICSKMIAQDLMVPATETYDSYGEKQQKKLQQKLQKQAASIRLPQVTLPKVTLPKVTQEQWVVVAAAAVVTVTVVATVALVWTRRGRR